MNLKEKNIVQEEDPENLINKQLDKMINEAYNLQPSCILEEHHMKTSILIEVQDTSSW